MKLFKTWLKPPIFADEEQTERAFLLHVILWALVCVPIPYLMYSLVIAPELLQRSLIQSLVGEFANVSLLILLRQGRVRLAAILQVIAFWLFFTVTAWVSNGVRGEAYLLGYGLVIAIAGTLLGASAAALVMLASLIMGGWMVYAQAQGWIGQTDSSALTVWVASLLIFPIGAVLQQLSTRSYQRALRQARENAERYRRISRASSDYTFSTEMNATGAQQLNWVAGAFEAMTGYTYAEYVARGGWTSLLHPEDVQIDLEARDKLAKNQTSVHEVRTFTKSGALQWVRVYSYPVWDAAQNQLSAIVGAVQDITEQKHTEEALRAERDLLQLFMDNIPELLYLKDRELRYLRLNKAQARFLNLDKIQAALGKTDLDLLPQPQAQRNMEQDVLLITNGEVVSNQLEFNLAPDGKPRWFSTTKVPLRDSTGEVIGLIGISRDVSIQKHAEDRETRRRQTLEKIVRLGQYVAQVQDLDTALQRVWHIVCSDLGFDRTGIFLFDSFNNMMHGTYGTNTEGEMIDETYFQLSLDIDSPETAAFKETLQEAQGVSFTKDYENDYFIPKGHLMYGVKDHAMVAAWAGDQPVALIGVDNLLSGRPITEENLEALRLFAGYAGLAIANARLNDALESELTQHRQAKEQDRLRRTMLEKVIQLGKQVTEVSSLRNTVERIWHGVHDELGFDRLAIFLYDPESHSIRGSLGTSNQGEIVEEWEYERSLYQEKPTSFTRALERTDGVYITTNFDEEFNIPAEHEMYGVKDFAAVTAWGGTKPVAIITVDNFPSKRPFTQEQIEALRLFSGYAGLAIENARLNMALEQDLNARKTLIEELELKNAELERFTYTVSHDLKSPLVTITGFLGYLEEDALAGKTQKVKADIIRIVTATKKMQALLNDLLELSRIGRLINPPENVAFNEVVFEAVDRVRGTLDELDALVEIETDLPVVRGDRIRLVEVIQNLIENAAKYAKPGGRTRIEIGQDRRHPDTHTFFVRDNGIGIAAEYHETIFGLFNKLDPMAEGTGIGLTLVKRIIEVHNGQIWVESEPDRGATFFFTLQMPD